MDSTSTIIMEQDRGISQRTVGERRPLVCPSDPAEAEQCDACQSVIDIITHYGNILLCSLTLDVPKLRYN